MLDLHPLSLVTIAIGFLIAYGLHQAIEFVRRRHRRQRAADAAALAAKSSEPPPTPRDLNK